MNLVEKRLSEWEWNYSSQDSAALAELTKRIEEAMRSEELIFYSDLVEGVTFRIESVNDGKPFEIDRFSWSELNRSILGDFLGNIAAKSYLAHGFLASAVAVSVETRQPTEPFFRWARDLGLLSNNSEFGRLEFWNDQVKRAYEVYSAL